MEEIKKKSKEIEITIGRILEMLKKNPMTMKFVEEEIVIDVKFVNESTG